MTSSSCSIRFRRELNIKLDTLYIICAEIRTRWWVIRVNSAGSLRNVCTRISAHANTHHYFVGFWPNIMTKHAVYSEKVLYNKCQVKICKLMEYLRRFWHLKRCVLTRQNNQFSRNQHPWTKLHILSSNLWNACVQLISPHHTASFLNKWRVWWWLIAYWSHNSWFKSRCRGGRCVRARTSHAIHSNQLPWIKSSFLALIHHQIPPKLRFRWETC